MDFGIVTEGKEYISASRAAVKSGYASDYIGQLCRAKKIPARLIGRTWYLDLEALIEHKKKAQPGKRKQTSTNKISKEEFLYEHDERPLLPELLKSSVPLENKSRLPKLHKTPQSLVVSVALLAVLTFTLWHRPSPAISLKNSTAEFATASVLGAISDSVEFLIDGFRNLRQIAFGTSTPKNSPNTSTSESQVALNQPDSKNISQALSQTTPSLDVEILRSDLKSELEKYVRTQISLASEPRVIYQTTTPVINTTVLRDEILLADTRPAITRQSDSDSSHRSASISSLTDGGRFTNAIITGGSIGGTSASLTTLTVEGTSILNGLVITNSVLTSNAQSTFTKVPTLSHMFTPSWPSGTSNADDGTIYINPASSVADGNLISAAVGGNIKFLVDAEGDIYGGNLILSGSTSQGATTIAGNLTIQDSTTFGDAATDMATSTAQFIVLASTTLQNFTFQNATGTSATTTALGINASNPTLIINDTRDQSWTVGDEFGGINFSSNDTSSGGYAGKVRTRIAAVELDAFGASQGLAFYTTRIITGVPAANMLLDQNGNLIISRSLLTAPYTTESGQNHNLVITGTGGGGNGGIQLSQSASSATNNGQSIGAIEWHNMAVGTSTASSRSAYIKTILSGTTGSDIGSAMTFATEDNGIGSTGAATERMRIDSNGRIGIGTTSPYAKVSISGNVTDTAPALFTIASTTSGTATTTHFTVLNNGNIGIGTESPGATIRLNVQTSGTGNNTGIFSQNTSTGATSQVAFYGYQSSNDTTLNQAGGFFVGRPDVNASGGYVYGVVGEGRSRAQVAGFSVGGYFNAGTSQALSVDAIRTTDSVTLTRSVGLIANASDDASGVSNIFEGRYGGTVRYVIDNLGRVGIGTSTPSHQLTISSSTVPQLTLTDGTAGSAPFSFRQIGSALYIATSSQTSFATGTTPVLTVNGTTGNLGIGTASPAAKLDVTGNILVSGGSGTISTPDVTTGNSNALSILTGNSTAVSGVSSTGNLVIGSGNTTGVAGATQSGNVTIQTGTATNGKPSGTLALITGNISSGAGPAGNITLTPGNATGAGSTGGSVVINAGSGAITNGSIILGNTLGLVAIGTSTPSHQLTVASLTGPQLTLTDGTAGSAPFSFRQIGSALYIATSSQTSFATSTNTILILSGTTGNIGISSSTPSARLSVTGSGATSATNSFIVEDSAGVDTFSVRDNGAGAIGKASVSLTANSFYSNLAFGADFSQTQTITNNSGNGISALVTGVGNEIRFAGSSEFTQANAGHFVAASINTNASNILNGVFGNALVQSASGRATTLRGGNFQASTNDASGGTFTNVTGARVTAAVGNAGATVTNLHGLFVDDFSIVGTASNTYGVRIGDVTSGTQTNTAYSLYASDANALNYFAGSVGIASTSPTRKLVVVDGTSYGAGYGEQIRLDGSSAVGAGIGFHTQLGSANRRNWFVGTEIVGEGDFGFMKSSAAGGFPSAGSGGVPFIITRIGNIGIGTTTPTHQLTVASSTGPQLTLTDGTAGSAPFSFRQIGSALYIATSSQTSFATSTNNSLVIDGNSGNLIIPQGRVGIGTTTPEARLHVVGNGEQLRLGTDVSNYTSFLVTSGILSIDTTSGGFNFNNGGLMQRVSSGNIGIGENSPASLLSVAGNGSFGSGYSTTAAPSNGLIVQGSVGIGTTSPWAKLSVVGNAAFPTLPNNATGYYACINTAGGGAELATSTTACGASSIRYKENVLDISYGLDQVLAMRPVSFDWKKDFMPEGTHQIGFIAEEMESVIPEVIGYDSNGQVMNMDYAKLTSILTKAIQQIASITGAFKTNIVAWLGDATNGIQDFFANRVHTKELCVSDNSGETCISKAQLDLLLGSAGTGGSISGPSGGSGNDEEGSDIGDLEIVPPDGGGDASSTPETVDGSSVEPESTPGDLPSNPENPTP